MGIRVIDISDLLFFPDSMRNPQDIINNIHVRLVETPHTLNSLGAGVQQPPVCATLGSEGDVKIGGHYARLPFATRYMGSASFLELAPARLGSVGRRIHFILGSHNFLLSGCHDKLSRSDLSSTWFGNLLLYLVQEINAHRQKEVKHIYRHPVFNNQIPLTPIEIHES